MKRFQRVLIAAVALLCLMAAWTLPVWAEDGGEVLPPVEDTGGGEDVPEEMPEEPPSTEEDAAPEDEGDMWDMEEIKAYVNGTVIPAAIMVVTALATLYVALVPIFNKVKAVIAKFNQASDDITATAGESELTKKNTKAALDKLLGQYADQLKQNEQLQAQYIALGEKYRELETFVKGAMEDMKDFVVESADKLMLTNEQIEKMLIVGFCNNKELMDKGYARKIAELGAGIDVRASGEKEGEHEQGNIEGGA
jgi:hypothetical protein